MKEKEGKKKVSKKPKIVSKTKLKYSMSIET
jgi:hypothetical protein